MIRVKRVTIEVDDKLHRAMRSKATQEGKSTKEVVTTLLEGWLRGEEKAYQMVEQINVVKALLEEWLSGEPKEEKEGEA